MKKTLIFIAVLFVGSVTAFAQKYPKTYGPVNVKLNVGKSNSYTRIDYALQDKNVLAVYTNVDGDIRFVLTKAGSSTPLNKTDNTEISAGTLYLASGSNTTWDANDLAGGNPIKIIGFKGKSAVVQFRFAVINVTRLYSFNLTGKGAEAKVLGSTQNITNANYTDSTSDGKKVFVQADFDDTGTDLFREYSNKLEKTPAKPAVAKTQYTVEGTVDVTLPLTKNQYNYDIDKSADDHVVTIHK